MTTRVESAVKLFSEGFNCAQAVFSTYAPLFGVEERCALRVSTGFGAGMGRLQEVCGAATGAFMVIGCKHGMTSSSDTDEKEKAYGLIKEFEKRFCHLYGSISCRQLLGCDLNTEEGKRIFKEKNLTKVKCTEYVRDASRLVEQMIL
jgi:C_GCAxxG_C_C family probable redox protein